MKHAYYISDDLDELETVHDELIVAGLEDQHIHVLSDEDIEVEHHHMRPVHPLYKTNIVRAIFSGAVIGAGLSAIVMAIPFIFAFESSIGTIPFTFVGIFIVVAATWKAGSQGLKTANERFKEVFNRIHQGQHLMIVDYNIEEENHIRSASRAHPNLQMLYLKADVL